MIRWIDKQIPKKNLHPSCVMLVELLSVETRSAACNGMTGGVREVGCAHLYLLPLLLVLVNLQKQQKNQQKEKLEVPM